VVSVEGSAADYELVGFTTAMFQGDRTIRHGSLSSSIQRRHENVK
jgi:hypothetical protein